MKYEINTFFQIICFLRRVAVEALLTSPNAFQLDIGAEGKVHTGCSNLLYILRCRCQEWENCLACQILA